MRKRKKKITPFDINSTECRAALAKLLMAPLMPKRIAKPRGSKCLFCESPKIKVFRAPMSHWAMGTFKCDACGKTGSLTELIGKMMVKVELLP